MRVRYFGRTASICALAFTAASVALGDDTPAGQEAVKATAGETPRSLVDQAMALLGVAYRRGGTTPESGLDCSGLVRLVFARSFELDLPHRAQDISRLGTPIAQESLKPGDLVFFNTLRKAFSHVGIYLGHSQFLHAPSAGGVVRIEDLREKYWRQRFDGARRLSAAGDDRD